MLTWIDRTPIALFVVIALTLGLAPFLGSSQKTENKAR